MANKTDERLLDSFREVSGGGMRGRDEAPGTAAESAGALKDELSAGTTGEKAGASPEAVRGKATDPLWGEMRQEPASADAATAREQAEATWEALSPTTTPEAGGVEAPTAQEQAKALLDAQVKGLTSEAVGATAAVAREQAGGNLYGESGTPAGSSVHSSSSSDTGSSTGSSAESMATGYFAGGGILSLIGGLLGLFGGGSPAPPVLEKYQMPSAISFESAETGSGLSASDFDQMGAPRPYSSGGEAPAGTSSGAAPASARGTGGGTSGSGGNAAAPQISVTVQTMDAQSFLDNSDQIAKAVRGAMLNLSSINDIVGEL